MLLTSKLYNLMQEPFRHMFFLTPLMSKTDEHCENSLSKLKDKIVIYSYSEGLFSLENNLSLIKYDPFFHYLVYSNPS